jgi:DNA modification methylase
MATIPDDPDSEENETTRFAKEPSILEQKAYRDTWGRGLDSYIQWFFETTVLLRELLTDSGSIYVHCDSGVNSYIRAVLDEVFGYDGFRNEITWRRANAHNDPKRCGIITDTLYYYAKGEESVWNPVYNPYSQSYIESHWQLKDESGRRYRLIPLDAPRHGDGGLLVYDWKGKWPAKSRTWANVKEKMERFEKEGRIVYTAKGTPCLKRFIDETRGLPLQNLWDDIPPVNPMAKERLDYATQKPEALLERILTASSNEGDLVLDCFVGSGTTAAVAEKLIRRWIACDLGRFAIHTTRKRLLGLPGVKPFVVQNLGKYERQAWQMAEFPANGKDHLEEQRQREAAYRQFILDLYHAKSLTGHTWLHGTKGGRMVHVAAVDAPVTQADVKAIAREAWKAIGSVKDAPSKAGVDILGWEFALEVNELAKQVAGESRVDVSFKKIPREVLDKKAVEQGDVKFFELGALAVHLKQKGREATLKMSDLVIPTDDIPEEARKAIKHWSQLVDYWAVDWDYKNDTFHNQWQAYRTRKDPKIELETKYEYKEPGKYLVVVKVIDILGNDTTKTLEVTVK